MRKRLMAVLAVSFLLTQLSAMSVSADGLEDSRWLEFTSEETTEDSAEDIAYSMLRGSNLAYGDAMIGRASSYEVHIYGDTQCLRVCDNVYLSLYLEQKSDGYYGTYRYWNFETTNAGYLLKGLDVLVPSGHYYRLRGYHSAVKDGVRESVTTLTDGIYIG